MLQLAAAAASCAAWLCGNSYPLIQSVLKDACCTQNVQQVIADFMHCYSAMLLEKDKIAAPAEAQDTCRSLKGLPESRKHRG